MAVRAQITINAVVGTEDDAAIGVLAQLGNNEGSPSASTYLWSILDQPPGTADVLSSTGIAAPTITPRKEGCYLLCLVVNQGLETEKTDTQALIVRQVRTRNAPPAAGEALQRSSSKGWSADVNAMLLDHDDLLSKGLAIVGVAGVAGLASGDVLRASGSYTLNAGLTFPLDVISWTKATAATAGNVDETLAILEGGVDGDTTPAQYAPIRVRLVGFYGPVAEDGAVSGDPVYVGDTAALSLVAGTNSRIVGSVTRAGENDYDMLFNGMSLGGGGGGEAEVFATADHSITIDGATTYQQFLGRTSAVTALLPAAPASGHTLVIKDGDGNADSYFIDVVANGSDTIDGAASYSMRQNAEGIILRYNAANTNWEVYAGWALEVDSTRLTIPAAPAARQITAGDGLSINGVDGATANLGNDLTVAVTNQGAVGDPAASLVDDLESDEPTVLAGHVQAVGETWDATEKGLIAGNFRVLLGAHNDLRAVVEDLLTKLRASGAIS